VAAKAALLGAKMVTLLEALRVLERLAFAREL
jgi:hypothetical protein